MIVSKFLKEKKTNFEKLSSPGNTWFRAVNKILKELEQSFEKMVIDLVSLVTDREIQKVSVRKPDMDIWRRSEKPFEQTKIMNQAFHECPNVYFEVYDHVFLGCLRWDLKNLSEVRTSQIDVWVGWRELFIEEK